jgi:uroporphyrin-3 C-methyltransferase
VDKDKTPPIPEEPAAIGGNGGDGKAGGAGGQSDAPGGKSPEPAVDATPKATPVRRRGGGVWVLLVVILALGVAAYALWPRYGERLLAVYSGNTGPRAVSAPAPDGARPPVATPAMDGEQPAPVEPALAEALEAETVARETLASALRGEMADLHLRLNSQQERLRQLSSTSREDWLLAEAEYLLRLASQRILTERQTANAAALLESADAILRDLDDPALFPVRKALADDITRLRMVEPVDRDGIYLRLGALVDAVDQLKSLLPEPPEAPPSAAAPPAESLPWHQRLLANARAALTRMVGLVRIERRDLPAEPMLTLEQEQALRHNLRLVLEQARLALLREEQTIYRASLDRAAAWVRAHFAQDAGATAFGTELAALAEQSVARELPSLDGSLRALRDYTRLWHNRHGEGEAAAPPGQAPTATGMDDAPADEAATPEVDAP